MDSVGGTIKWVLTSDNTQFSAGMNAAKSEASETASSVNKQFSDMTKNMGALGRDLTKKVTAPIVALGTAAVLSASSYQNSMSTIIKMTGATGDEIAGLETVFKNVARSVPESMDSVATAIGEVSVRLNLQGEELEQVTKNFLAFARVNNVDVQSAIPITTKMMNALGVSMEEIPLVLDKLTFASQNSGISVESLANNIISAGPAFEQLGFDLDRSIALFSQFEQYGARPEEVVASLGLALNRLAKEGFTNAQEAFEEYLDRIKEAPGILEAVTIANDLFGARVGAKVAEDIRAGRFEIDEWVEALQGAEGAVQATDEASTTFGDSMQTLRNRVSLALQPMGQDVIEIIENNMLPVFEQFLETVENAPEPIRNMAVRLAALAAAAGPVLVALHDPIETIEIFTRGATDMGKILTTRTIPAIKGYGLALKINLIPWLTTATTGVWAFTAALLANPITWIVIAIIAVIALLYLAWTTNFGGIQEKTQAVFEWVEKKFNDAKEWFEDLGESISDMVETAKPHLETFGKLLLGPIGWIWLLKDSWDENSEAIIKKAEELKDKFEKFFKEDIPAAIGWVIQSFIELPSNIAAALGNVLGTIVKWGTDAWDYLTENVPKWIESVGVWFSELPDKIWEWLTKVYEDFVKWGTDTWTYLSTEVTKWVNGIVKWISELPGKIWKWLEDLYNRFKKWGTDTWDYISEEVPKWVENVVKWLSELPGKAYDALSDLWTKIKERFTETWDGIVAEVSTWPGKLMDWGEKIATAFVDGIKNALGGVKDAFIGAFNNARGAVEGQSPPKEGPFKDIDKWGYNVGSAWIEGFGDAVRNFNNIAFSDPISPRAAVSAGRMQNQGISGSGVKVDIAQVNIREEGDITRIGEEIGFRTGLRPEMFDA